MIEKKVSKGIISTYFAKMEKCLELDVAIVGGGPSGIAAAYYMAKRDLKWHSSTASYRQAVVCGAVQ